MHELTMFCSYKYQSNVLPKLIDTFLYEGNIGCYPTNIYFSKSVIETLEKGVKYVQS